MEPLKSDISLPVQKRQSFAYSIVSYLIVFPIFRIFLRGKTEGNHRVPSSGPLVVVANHGSDLDPPILGHALGRPVSFMAKAELFKIPFLSNIIRSCGAYPVKRGASDREAIKTATKILLDGSAIGLFLDGTRQADGRVNKPMAGAAFLSARSGAPLLPVAIINSHRALGKNSRWIRFVPVHMRIGKLIPPPLSRRKEDLEYTTKRLKDEINSLIDDGLIC